MKWSTPHFDYKGMFCGIAAFKEHVDFGFWKAGAAEGAAARSLACQPADQFGRIASIDDLPSDRELARILKIAKKLNDEEVKAPPMRKGPAAGAEGAGRSVAALAKNKKARATFDGFPPGQRRDTSPGSSKPSRPRRARSGSRPRSSGWPRARFATGST